MLYLTGHSYGIQAEKASCSGKILRGDDYWQSQQNSANDGDFGFLWSLAIYNTKRYPDTSATNGVAGNEGNS